MSNPLGLPALISPYVGGKGRSRYFIQAGGVVRSRICDLPHHYDCIVEPFAGSGAATWQHNHGIAHAIAADVNPGVQAAWECWGRDDERDAVLKLLEWHKERMRLDASGHFETLIENSNNRYFCMGFVAAAASYLTLKRLVFGGVLRCNREGKLNVALSQDKLEKYLAGWDYQWPDNGIQQLTFKHSWEDAVQALADSDYSNALVVIDPPYYSPQEWVEERKDGSKRKSKMTPAYPGHDPQSADELALCVDCIGELIEMPNKVGRIVVFNYYSDDLDSEIRALCKFNGCEHLLNVSHLGYLGGMNNAQKFHGRDIEAVWEIGGKRMFQDCDAIQQGNLFPVVS